MLRALVLTAALAVADPALAQDRAQTLADIRAELALLAGQIDGLRAELARSGAGGGAA
ncbi:MAG: tol-pal system protein, partial [Rhodobacterales bacterium]|nr:tol-pal system protein [Rhodobacterales bacterium]